MINGVYCRHKKDKDKIYSLQEFIEKHGDDLMAQFDYKWFIHIESASFTKSNYAKLSKAVHSMPFSGHVYAGMKLLEDIDNNLKGLA